MTRTPPRKAPFKDRTGRTMYEGDTVISESGLAVDLILRFSDLLNRWMLENTVKRRRRTFIIRNGMCTLTRAPRAVTVREFWKDNGTPGYKVSLDGEPMLLTDAEHLNYAIAHVMPSRP